MEKKHRVMTVDSVVLAHSTIVQMQQELGSSALLGLKLCCPQFVFIVYVTTLFCLCNMFCPYLVVFPASACAFAHFTCARLTIILMDATVWPSRVWFLNLSVLFLRLGTLPSLPTQTYYVG
jgi:hypothetical protein